MLAAGEWLKAVAAGKSPAADAVVPLLETLGARVAGLSYRQMSGEATAWANALTQVARLVGSGALAVGWDPTLLAEACGAPIDWQDDEPRLNGPAPSLNGQAKSAGRLPAYLDAARRLCQTFGGEGACLLAVTGPATLARQVFAEAPAKEALSALKPVLVAVVEELCQGRPAFLCFMESGAAVAAGPTPELRRIYHTLKNIAAYYGVAPAIHLSGGADLPAALGQWQAVGLDHLILGADSREELGRLAQAGTAARFFTLRLGRDADIEAIQSDARQALTIGR